jgi:hypothetical protein
MHNDMSTKPCENYNTIMVKYAYLWIVHTQDKLLCKVFCEDKKLNLELENSFAEIAYLRSMHIDMSAKPCENYNMVMVNYAYLWIVHTQVVSQLKGAKLELKELKARSLLLGACTSCFILKI